METQSSFLAGELPQTEEPGGLQSMGLQRVRHDLVTKQTYMNRSHACNYYIVQRNMFNILK